MDKDPRLMTVEEYGMFLMFQISEAPKVTSGTRWSNT